MSFILIVLVAVFLSFVGFTFYCLRNESFFKSAADIFKFHWGKQFIFDLYIGLFIFHIFVYFIEGSILKTVFWLLPSLLLGNIVCLVYLILNFERIIAIFF